MSAGSLPLKRIVVLLCLVACILALGWLGWVRYVNEATIAEDIKRNVTPDLFPRREDRQLAAQIRRLEYKAVQGYTLTRQELQRLQQGLNSPVQIIQIWTITALANLRDPAQGQWAVSQLVAYLNRHAQPADDLEQAIWSKAALAFAAQIKKGRKLDMEAPEHRLLLTNLTQFVHNRHYEVPARLRVQRCLDQIRVTLAHRMQ